MVSKPAEQACLTNETTGCIISPHETQSPSNRLSILGLNYEDVVLGDLLGSGSFSEVLELKCVRHSRPLVLSKDNFVGLDEESDDASTTTTATTTTTSTSNSLSSSTELALKRLQKESILDPKRGKQAVRDMGFEAAILARIVNNKENSSDSYDSGRSHIIHLHAVSADFFSKPLNRFLVLDLIVETLEQRLKYWRQKQDSGQRIITGNNKLHRKYEETVKKSAICSDHRKISLIRIVANALIVNPRRKQKILVDPERARIANVGLGVAKGMAFLHSQGILFRDLKPANVGFDAEGRVRIFDFGLAREIQPPSSSSFRNNYEDEDKPKNNKQCYITGVAGTYRYMAPEVFSGKKYSFPADVYSFSMLLYETITLRKPLSHIQYPSQVHRLVVEKNVRPPLSRSCCSSEEMQDLLRKGWHQNPDIRPSFDTIVNRLGHVAAIEGHY